MPTTALSNWTHFGGVKTHTSQHARCVGHPASHPLIISNMLLTITTTHRPATDLGYLLHKNPANLHSFDLSFGKAHVFYPEAVPDRCTAALLLDVDPIGLVRGKRGQHEGGTLDQYVNDRPYVLSSFLSVAMGRAFGTEMVDKSWLICRSR